MPFRWEDFDSFEEIGRGGMAVVYKARQVEIQRPVALKVLPEELLASDFMTRFQQEAELVAQFSHPNIVRILGVSAPDSKRQFIAMEYIDGSTLSEMVRANGPLPLEQAAYVISNVARALQYAHDRHCIHRDVKPGNVMVQAGTSRVVLMDFGIAKATNALHNLTMAGMNIGTPTFMSPEQCRGEVVDHRADIYSLGVLFYFLLVGEPPFTGDQFLVMNQHLTGAPPSPRARRPDLPPWVDELIACCMTKDPAQRYQAAGQLAAGVDQYLSGHPVVLSIPRASKPHRTLVLTLGSLCLCLAVTITWLLFARPTDHGSSKARAGGAPPVVALSPPPSGANNGGAGTLRVAVDWLRNPNAKIRVSPKGSPTPLEVDIRDNAALVPGVPFDTDLEVTAVALEADLGKFTANPVRYTLTRDNKDNALHIRLQSVPPRVKITSNVTGKVYAVPVDGGREIPLGQVSPDKPLIPEISMGLKCGLELRATGYTRPRVSLNATPGLNTTITLQAALVEPPPRPRPVQVGTAPSAYRRGGGTTSAPPRRPPAFTWKRSGGGLQDSGEH